MNDEMISFKEEAILLAKDKMEDAVEAISEFLPEVAEELNWFLDEMANQLIRVRSERLSLMNSSVYGEGNV